MTFNPLSAAFAADPHGVLRGMQEKHRAYRHRDTLTPLVSFFRHSDAEEILGDWQTWSSDRGEEVRRAGLGDAMILLFDDPPVHNQRKKIVRPHFSLPQIETLRDSVAKRIDHLLDQVGDSPFDVVDDFAAPVTIGTIGGLVGCGDADIPQVRAWTKQLGKIDGIANFVTQPDPELEATGSRILQEMQAFFEAKIEGRDRDHPPDLVSTLLQSDLSFQETVSLAKFLLHAGNETTTNLVANLLYQLNANPDQLALLLDNPDLIENAVEETLRMFGAFRETERIAARDVEVGDTVLRKGETAVVWIAAANRDPDVFENPHKFDITRSTRRHLTFGRGIHLCLGFHLARLEARLVLERLLSRGQWIHTDNASAIVGRNPLMNGIEHLPGRLQPLKNK